jgi:hypothetical protein
MITENYSDWLVAYDNNNGGVPQAPPRIVEYFAYKNGECKKFDNKLEATAFSKNIEQVCVNAVEIKEIRAAQFEYIAIREQAWYDQIKANNEVTDNEFDLIVNMLANDINGVFAVSDDHRYDDRAIQIEMIIELMHNIKHHN